jgi:hypothetical protein
VAWKQNSIYGARKMPSFGGGSRQCLEAENNAAAVSAQNSVRIAQTSKDFLAIVLYKCASPN